MREITTSLYTFENLITYNCIYVDKTKYIYKMLMVANGQFFCSRPRRFGKSLTISTLEAIFKGKRELFKGLYIDSTDYDWSVHPVIHVVAHAICHKLAQGLCQNLLTTSAHAAKKWQASQYVMPAIDALVSGKLRVNYQLNQMVIDELLVLLRRAQKAMRACLVYCPR